MMGWVGLTCAWVGVIVGIRETCLVIAMGSLLNFVKFGSIKHLLPSSSLFFVPSSWLSLDFMVQINAPSP